MVEDVLVQFFASFFIYLLFVGLIVLWFIDGKIKKEQVVHAIYSCLFASVISSLIKHFFPTLRPYVINGLDTDVFMLPLDSAFPSAHTTIAFALSTTIFMHDRKVGWFFLVGALTVGIARVLANVHYPVDILGGAFLGTIVAVIVDKMHFLRFVTKLTPRLKKK